MKHTKFSLPLWPGLSPTEIEEIIPQLIKAKDCIADLYITCRSTLFSNDAMGGCFISGEEEIALSNAIYVSEATGIPLSATYNDITVSPSYQNYLEFVKHFRPLYERGILIVTIPNTSWLKFGLKSEFKELYVKNTVLNRVYSASEVASLFEDGFDYINLDRNLIRDEDTLAEILEAKKILSKKLNRDLKVSVLFNEGCKAHCTIQTDHYVYNLNRTTETSAFFYSEMSNIAPCSVPENGNYILRAASVPAYYSHIVWLSTYIDVFKLHGRESRQVFYESLSLLKQFSNRELITDKYRAILNWVEPKLRESYLLKIRNCKFNCWKCELCTAVASSANC